MWCVALMPGGVAAAVPADGGSPRLTTPTSGASDGTRNDGDGLGLIYTIPSPGGTGLAASRKQRQALIEARSRMAQRTPRPPVSPAISTGGGSRRIDRIGDG